MPKKLASLLLIALMLAVPLRALAGVGMACSMADHAAMQMSHDMGHDMPAGHCQDMQSASADMGAQHAQDGCNLCADCCLGTVSIPAAVQFAFAGKPGSDLVFSLAHAYAGFLPDGPERPPRHAVL